MNTTNKITVKLKPDSWVAKLAAYKLKASSVALVIGRTIHLHNASVDSFLNNTPWLLHELKHVEQYEQYGLLKFLWIYLKESLQNGYHANRLEVEARNAEQDYFLKNQYEIVTI